MKTTVGTADFSVRFPPLQGAGSLSAIMPERQKRTPPPTTFDHFSLTEGVNPIQRGRFSRIVCLLQWSTPLGILAFWHFGVSRAVELPDGRYGIEVINSCRTYKA
jgi:hypothetical protein